MKTISFSFTATLTRNVKTEERRPEAAFSLVEILQYNGLYCELKGLYITSCIGYLTLFVCEPLMSSRAAPWCVYLQESSKTNVHMYLVKVSRVNVLYKPEQHIGDILRRRRLTPRWTFLTPEWLWTQLFRSWLTGWRIIQASKNVGQAATTASLRILDEFAFVFWTSSHSYLVMVRLWASRPMTR